MATLDDDDRAFIEAVMAPLRKDIDRHERDIHGNGQAGIDQRVTILEALRGRVSIATVLAVISSLTAAAAAIATFARVGL